MTYKYIKSYRKRYKQKLVDLMGGKCMVCGYNRCIKALDFHHIDPKTKEFTISRMESMNWDSTFKEAKKCVLLCANCHRELHDGLIDCPLPIEIEYEKLSSYWVDWKNIPLEEELQKLTINEVAKKYNISNKTVYKECAKMGIDIAKIKKSKYVMHRFDVSKEELQKLVLEMPFSAIGKKFGVSDNAIRKRCKKLGIPIPKNGRGYWTKKGIWV
jgi:hypothetical protein